MSAEVLRQAAALMRERASGETTPGPWVALPESDEYLMRGTVVDGGIPGERFVICEHAGSDATHIASWHPAVALAVADWLDAEAEHVTRGANSVTFGGAPMFPPSPQALAVATAYLGTTS